MNSLPSSPWWPQDGAPPDVLFGHPGIQEVVLAGGLQRPRPRILGVVRRFCIDSREWIGKEEGM